MLFYLSVTTATSVITFSITSTWPFFHLQQQPLSIMSTSNKNGGNKNNKRLRQMQKVAVKSSKEGDCLDQKLQLETARSLSSLSLADDANSSNSQQKQLDDLPLDALVIVASQLPFADFKNVGMISKPFNTAQRTARHSRKNVSVDLLRKLFPKEVPIGGAGSRTTTEGDSDDKNNEEQQQNGTSADEFVGMLQVMRPLRLHLRSSPPRNITEVDFSGLGSFRESQFTELFQQVDNGRELFADVRRLSVQKCVVELKDMAFLAELMAKVWHIRCSPQTLVIPGETDDKMTLSADQMRQLRAKVENFDQLFKESSKKHLWFIAQLTELFPELEMVQLDN